MRPCYLLLAKFCYIIPYLFKSSQLSLAKQAMRIDTHPFAVQMQPSDSRQCNVQQVQSPIFQNQPRLPTPLGSFLYTSPYFTKLPIWDRLTALPLLGPLMEVDSSEEAYNHYDQISALELFKKKGVSQRLLR